MIVEDCLHMSVWQAKTYRQFIVADSGPGQSSKLDLRSFKAKHTDATVRLVVGDTAKTSELQMWFLRWCRGPACRCLISASVSAPACWSTLVGAGAPRAIAARAYVPADVVYVLQWGGVLAICPRARLSSVPLYHTNHYNIYPTILLSLNIVFPQAVSR